MSFKVKVRPQVWAFATTLGLEHRRAFKRAVVGLAEEKGEIKALGDKLSGYYRLNSKIHTLINDAANNPVLSSTYRSINARVQSLRFRTNQNETKWKRAIKEHEAMLEALIARDAPSMRTILVQHLNNKRDTVLDLMRAGEIYPAANLGA